MNAPEDRLGSKLGHGSDVRCTTALPPKPEVHPRSCYVAQVPTPDLVLSNSGLPVDLPGRHVGEFAYGKDHRTGEA
jgi:hypothetical protein